MKMLILVLALLLSGCAAQQTPPTTEAPVPITEATIPQAAIQQIMDVSLEAALMEEPPNAAIPEILQPQADGIQEERTDAAVIDYSHTSDGYVMAQFLEDTTRKLKVRVAGPTTTYTYNLHPGTWDVLPLSDGNGHYKVTIYRGVGGQEYATVMSTSFDAEMADEFAPFLRPNQYVNYEDAPDTMAMGQELCLGIDAPLEKVAAVYDYVVDSMSYDYHKASTVKSGYLPELDLVLSEKKGICFDYAALMAAMLRSQKVPCKLVVGYAGSAYHAWISVWTEENGWIDGAIFFDGQNWKRMDPTFASSSERSESVMNFIETGNYQVKYLY